MARTETQSISDRYVKALYDLAEAVRAVDQVEGDLQVLRARIKDTPELITLIENPLIARRQKADAMNAVLKKAKAAEVTQRFVQALAFNQRLELLPQVAQRFSAYVAAKRGVLRAQVRSAVALNDSQVKAIAEALSKAAGKPVSVEVSVDPKILGGLTVEIGGVMIDGSLSGKLRRIEKTLKSAVKKAA